MPRLLLLANVPLAVEQARRRREPSVPRVLAAVLQIPWTAFWLGSVLYVVILALFGVAVMLVKLISPAANLALPARLAPDLLVVTGDLVHRAR